MLHRRDSMPVTGKDPHIMRRDARVNSSIFFDSLRLLKPIASTAKLQQQTIHGRWIVCEEPGKERPIGSEMAFFGGTMYMGPEGHWGVPNNGIRQIGPIDIDEKKGIVTVNYLGMLGPSGKTRQWQYSLEGDELSIDTLGESKDEQATAKKLRLHRPGDDLLQQKNKSPTVGR